MIKFALKNLWTRRSKAFLSAISIVMATTIGLLAFNISSQVEDGIVQTVTYYDTLVGPTGSETQLALNTLFFTGAPIGTISYENYESLKNDIRVNDAIPFAMGDSYKGAKIVGTEARYLEKYKLNSGRLFNNSFEAVVGYNIAKENKLNIGNTFFTSHGISEVGGTGHQHAEAYTVSGILKKTNTAYDNVIFVNISDVWNVHNHAEEEHKEEEHIHGDITSILLKTKSPSMQANISAELNKISGLQAINPATVVRDIMENIDLSKQIVYVLCFVIGVMSFMIIYIIALLNMHDTKKDVKLMRLLGISKAKINSILIIQNLIITIISVFVSFILCRVLLLAVNHFTSSMGIVVNYLKIYNYEFLIIFAIIILSLVPSFIANIKSFRQDPINN